MRASFEEAATFAAENPERAAEIIVERTGLPAEAAERIPLPNSRADIEADQLQLWIDAMADQELLDSTLDPAGLVAP